jgi:hypothetical protein
MRRVNAGGTVRAISPDAVPLLIPQARMDSLGSEVYQCVIGMKCPAQANGGVCGEIWWNSAFKWMKENGRPMPGSYNGHDSDVVSFFSVGGKIENGAALVRLAIPSTPANADLINACKMGAQQFSNVAHCALANGEYGRETATPQIDAVKEGRIEQSLLNDAEEAEAMRLAASGKIDWVNESESAILNGKVSKLWAVKNQNGVNKAVSGRILNAIANARRRRTMKNGKYFNAEGEPSGVATEDALEALKTAIANNAISMDEVIAAIGAQNKVATPEQKNAARTVDEIRKFLELAPEAGAEEIKKALDELKKVADETSEAAAEVETNKLLPEGKLINNVENAAWTYAHGKIRLARNGEDRKKIIEGLKADSVFMALKKANAMGRPANPEKKRAGIWG